MAEKILHVSELVSWSNIAPVFEIYPEFESCILCFSHFERPFTSDNG